MQKERPLDMFPLHPKGQFYALLKRMRKKQKQAIMH